MKCNISHPFFQEIKKYSLNSMLYQIASFASKIFCEENKMFSSFSNLFLKKSNENPQIMVKNRKIVVVQTWLIDMAYEIAVSPSFGVTEISQEAFLDLYVKFCDYTNEKDKTIHKKDVFLRLFGFWGEQIRFQRQSSFFETYAREKYILEKCSSETNIPKEYQIDIAEQFKKITGLSTDEYGLHMFVLWALASQKCLFDINQISLSFHSSDFNIATLKKFVIKYSATIEEIQKSPLKRQFFYSRPFIQFSDIYYLSVNPFLILSCASNSIYWALRNYYARQKSQFFVNAFGYYFEEYVYEILERCLPNHCYKQISPENVKLADWQLNFGETIFLIEQKSTISYLQIKQLETDISKMKKYIMNTWGEAVKQLKSTQDYFQLKEPIKIILLYEDYYRCECLDELFKIDKTCPNNDGRYWLLTIREFESLMNLYRINEKAFWKIVNEKIKSDDRTDISEIMGKHGYSTKQYLLDFGIENEFIKIRNMLSEC